MLVSDIDLSVLSEVDFWMDPDYRRWDTLLVARHPTLQWAAGLWTSRPDDTWDLLCRSTDADESRWAVPYTLVELETALGKGFVARRLQELAELVTTWQKE